MGIQDPTYPTLMEKAGPATATLADSDFSALPTVHNKENIRYSFQQTSNTSSSAFPRHQQQQWSDNISMQWDLRYTDNYASGSQHCWEQEELVI